MIKSSNHTDQTTKKEKKNKPSSFSTVIEIIGFSSLKKNRFAKAALVATGFIVLCFDITSITQYLVNISIQTLPSLLGFSICAYAILVGLSSDQIISAIIKNSSKNNKLYEIISATFALNLTTQTLGIVVAITYKAFIELYNRNLDFLSNWGNNYIYIGIKNFLITTTNYLVIFLIVLSLLITFSTIKNIFSFTQLFIHLKKKNVKESPRNDITGFEGIRKHILNRKNTHFNHPSKT